VCGWQVKPDLLVTHGPYLSALEIIKRYINSPSLLSLFTLVSYLLTCLLTCLILNVIALGVGCCVA